MLYIFFFKLHIYLFEKHSKIFFDIVLNYYKSPVGIPSWYEMYLLFQITLLSLYLFLNENIKNWQWKPNIVVCCYDYMELPLMFIR